MSVIGPSGVPWRFLGGSLAIPWESNDKRPLETCLKPMGLCHWPWGDPWGFLEDVIHGLRYGFFFEFSFICSLFSMG